MADSGSNILKIVLGVIVAFILVIVLTVVSAVVLVVLTTVVGAAYVGQQLDAEFDAIMAEEAEFDLMRIELYTVQNGQPPASLDDLELPPLGDVWGNPYQYRVDGNRFEITTLGADGAPGGSGPDQDRTVSGGG